MGCGCGGGSGGTGRWKVIFPDGKFAIKKTLADAELAKARRPGSKIQKVS